MNSVEINVGFEIREIIERYLYSFDSRNVDLLSSCFTDDADGKFFSGDPNEIVLKGRRMIADYFLNSPSPRASNHTLCNMHLRINGETAEADAFGTTHRVSMEGEVFVRGLRYKSGLILTNEGWRISNFIHTVLWQHNALAVVPHIPTSGRYSSGTADPT